MSRRVGFAVLLGLLGMGSAPATPTAPLKVLFLGDKGHHKPADRSEQLIPVLASRGISVKYTEDLDQLNPANLAGYDALIIFANSTKIEPAQEKALVDYVEGGGGFVPIHSASYCFLNSPAYIDLVGAQFLRHGTGEFDTKVVDPDHAIMKGLAPFHTWDETYVHTKHNTKDRHVLQTRAEGKSEEPWTWTRTQGKGRIFYTAYGHDERTWGQPEFSDLIERGIRWAANQGPVVDGQPRVTPGLKPFEYVESDKIPVYISGAKWGAQGDPVTKMQKAISPAESVKHLLLPQGFEAKLFVSEPEIAKPIAMNWDHLGRLWVIETYDYPNELQPKGKGRDQIKICEDTDGDGKADKFTVFADHLSIPTSLLFYDGGVIVHQAPETLFLKDTDGDGKADVREVLLTGWGTNDTHAGPSNLRYGLDNWIWGIVGYSAFNGTVEGEKVGFRQGIYRFKADGSKLEFLRSTSNNSWGLGFSEEGLVFGSTANGCASVYMAIPNRFYEAVRGSSPSVLAPINDTNRFFPAPVNVRQVDWHGGFTAAAGHALYTARTYPPVYWNKTAFVSEPTGHLLATFTLHPHGSDFVSHNAWNLVASDDEWTSPISGEVGPDGNLWMIDWYNFIVQHNPTPQGFKTGKGAAYETPLRDKTHGRIYRIVAKDGKPSAIKSLDPSDTKGLIAALSSDNQFWRLHAQRLLVERGKKDVAADLIKLVSNKNVDTLGLNVGAIHALWTLRGLGLISEPSAKTATLAALKHPSAGVRRNAAAVLDRDENSAKALVESGLLNDADPQVRLATLLALAECTSAEPAGIAIAQALQAGLMDNDRWLTDAATSAAAAHDRSFLAAAARIKYSPAPKASLITVASKVAEHHARGGDSQVGTLIEALADADPQIAEPIVSGLAKGWPKDRAVTLTDGQERALGTLLTKSTPASRGALVNLAARWGTKGLEKYTTEIADAAQALVRDESKPEAARVAAARQLIELRPADAAAPLALLGMLTPKTPPGLAAGLVDAIGRSSAPEATRALIAAVPSLTPALKTTALRSVLSKPESTLELLAGVEAGKLRLTELSLDQTTALAAHPDKSIAARAKALIAKGGGLPDPDRQKVIDSFAPLVLKTSDAALGKEVFAKQCAKCHMHSGVGGKVGPDLTGMAAHPKEELLIHLLDPSRSVEGNFTQYTIGLSDGRVLNGLLASETKTAVELIDAEGKAHVLLREDIDDLVASKKSLMPEGFEKEVGPEGVANLLEFLTKKGKYLSLDLRKAATIVSTKGMFYDKEGQVERLIFPDWSPKTFEGVPFQLVDPQGDRVPNVIMLNSPNGTIAPTMPKSVSVPCNTSAKSIHMLSGISGWGATSPGPGTVSMIVRLHYADGQIEEHPLRDGIHFADYVRPIDVPGSKLAFRLRGQQLRYLSIEPKRKSPIERIEFVKGNDATAPIIMAVTIEGEA